MRGPIWMTMLLMTACGGPDARPVRVELDLLSRGASDHLIGRGVVAKSGGDTDDGFISGAGAPMLHAEVETSTGGTLLIEIVAPNGDEPRVRYREVVAGRATFFGVARDVRAELARPDGDWSSGGSFSFDAVDPGDEGEAHRVQNGRVFAASERDLRRETPIPSSVAGGGFGGRRLPRGAVRPLEDEERPGSRWDSYWNIVVVIDDVAGSAPTPPPEPEVESLPPHSISDDSSSESASRGTEGSDSTDSSGSGCSGEPSSSPSSESGGCSGDEASSSSSSEGCGGGSSSSSSSDGCGGGGDSCQGDAALGGSTTNRAAGASVRLVWPIGLVALVNRRARASAKRRRRSPSANRGSPSSGDR
jgi:hypothetical protein